MTVEQLAQQLGITVKEALALCTVAGVKVRDARSFLSRDDVDTVRRVLAGEKPLIDPTRPGGTPKGPKRSTGCGTWVIVGIVGVLVLLAVGGVLIQRFAGDRSINVAAGDCFDALLIGETVFGTSIDPAPCDDATYRAFAVLQLDEVFPTWPGVEAIEARARDRCIAIAEQLDVQGFGIYYFGPGDEVTWENPASRKIVCAEAN